MRLGIKGLSCIVSGGLKLFVEAPSISLTISNIFIEESEVVCSTKNLVFLTTSRDSPTLYAGLAVHKLWPL